MSRTLFIVALVLVASPLGADEAWTSPSGTGLITLPDTTTRERGHFTLGVVLDNRDRDPLGIDVLDGSAAWTFGLTSRAEAYGRHVFTRVVALPEPPALPPPPLDLIVAAGATAPTPPFYSFYAPIPYVNKRGTARFDDYVPGDEIVGVKVRLREASGRRPALAVAGEIKIPLTRDTLDLQSGAGTGGVDLTGRLIGEWRVGRSSLVTTAAYTRTGQPALSDRLVLLDRTGRARAVDLELSLPDQMELGVGARRVLGSRVAAVAEAWTAFGVGARTPVIDEARPLDLLGGLQMRLGAARLTLALRLHGNALPSGAVRRSPLAGLVDLTDVAPADLQAYLGALGASEALPQLRERSQRLLVQGQAHAPLPPGARVVPDSYRIRSEHQVGFVLLWGWTF